MSDAARTLVIGEGIAGQATALGLVERGVPVTLITKDRAPDTESVANREGIDVAMGAGDSPERHAADLAKLAGDGARSAVIRALAESAPALVKRLAAFGVPFDRERNGDFCLEKTRGSETPRTLMASSLTARHVSRRLSRSLSAFGGEALIVRSGEQVVNLVMNDAGHVAGVISRDLTTGELLAHPARGVCLATGGFVGLQAGSQTAIRALGGALGIAHTLGAKLANLSAVTRTLGYRAAGGVRALPEPLLALGSLSEDETLLDLTDVDRSRARRLAGPALLALYESTGRDALAEKIPVERAIARTLGGLVVGFDSDPDSEANAATNLPGLYAAGGAAALTEGRDAGPGTRLLEALFGAELAARALVSYRRSAPNASADCLENTLKSERERIATRFDQATSESEGPSPFELALELASDELARFETRLKTVSLGDRSEYANQSFGLLLELEAALPLARALIAEPGA